MRLAVSSIAWSPADDDDIGRALTSLGLDAVELAPTKIWGDLRSASVRDASEAAATWRARGFDVVALQALLFGRPELQLLSRDTQGAREFRDHLQHVIELGSAFGATALVLGSPKNRLRGGLAPHAAMERAAEVLGPLAERAAQRGTVLCIEPNPPHYGADFLTTVDEAAALVRTVDSPGLRLHLDTACAALVGDDIRGAVDDHGEVVQHAHLSARDLAPVYTSPDAGHRDLVCALAEIGYRGVISVEMLPVMPDPVAAVTAAAVYALTLADGG